MLVHLLQSTLSIHREKVFRLPFEDKRSRFCCSSGSLSSVYLPSSFVNLWENVRLGIHSIRGCQPGETKPSDRIRTKVSRRFHVHTKRNSYLKLHSFLHVHSVTEAAYVRHLRGVRDGAHDGAPCHSFRFERRCRCPIPRARSQSSRVTSKKRPALFRSVSR